MNKLINIYEQLITEIENNNFAIVKQSILDKKLINIYYDDETGNPDGKGWRRIEPFCLGKNKFGNICVRAWQDHGVSASYPPGKDGRNGGKRDPLTFVPGWRMFRVDKITNINTTGSDTFSSPRPKYNPQDKDMTEIYAAADFGTNTGGYTSYNTPPTAPTPATPAPVTNEPQASVSATAPVQPQTPAQPQSTNGYGNSGYASYQDKKASMFDKWADKFKNLIGYKPK